MTQSAQSLTLAAAAQMGDASLLTATETAAVLRVSQRTVERWRSTGEGPAFIRVGPRRVAYRVREVLAFAGAA